MPFLDAAARIDAAGVAFIEGVSTNLDYRTQRGGAGEHQSEAHRSRSARPRVPDRRDSRRRTRRAARCSILRRRSKSSSSSRTSRPLLPGIKVAVEDARGMYKEGADDAWRKSSRRRKVGAAAARVSASSSRPKRLSGRTNAPTAARRGHPTRPLFFTIAPGAAENYDKAVRVAQGYRVNAISKMLPISTADRIPADEKQKIDAAIPRQALVKPRAGEKAARHRRLSGRRFLPQHRRAREPDAAAHREIHRRVRADLRQQPREPAISAHQAVRRGVSQQRRRSRVLRSRGARRLDPLRARRRRRRRAAWNDVRLAGSARVRRVDGRAGRAAPVQRRAGHAEDRRSRRVRSRSISAARDFR